MSASAAGDRVQIARMGFASGDSTYAEKTAKTCACPCCTFAWDQLGCVGIKGTTVGVIGVVIVGVLVNGEFHKPSVRIKMKIPFTKGSLGVPTVQFLLI